MQRYLKFFILTCLFFIFLLPRVGITEDSSKWPLGFPKAETDGTEVLTLDEVRKIAAHEARRTWGDVYRIIEVPYANKSGLLVAYHVVFRLGTNQAVQRSEKDNAVAIEDSYSSIMQQIKDGRQLFREASKNLKEATPEMNRRIALKEEKEIKKYGDEIEEGDAATSKIKPEIITPTEAYKEAYEAREKGRRLMTGEGSYGTILVTVREGLVPVPVVSHGLPMYYTRGDAMQQIVKKRMGDEPKISMIYMAGPLDQWVEFTTSEGEKVIIDPFQGQIVPSDEVENVLPDEMYMTMPIEKAREKRRSILEAAEREISE